MTPFGGRRGSRGEVEGLTHAILSHFQSRQLVAPEVGDAKLIGVGMPGRSLIVRYEEMKRNEYGQGSSEA